MTRPNQKPRSHGARIHIAALVLAGAFSGGCAIYATPGDVGVGVVISPPPIIVTPRAHWRPWGFHGYGYWGPRLRGYGHWGPRFHGRGHWHGPRPGWRGRRY